MKVLHLGGIHAFVESLASNQRELGIDASTEGSDSASLVGGFGLAILESKIEGILRQSPDIIQFHTLKSLLSQNPQSTDQCEITLTRLRASGARLILYAYDDEPLQCFFSPNYDLNIPAPLTNSLISEFFEEVLIGRAHLSELAEMARASSLLALAVDFPNIKQRAIVEPQIGSIMVRAFTDERLSNLYSSSDAEMLSIAHQYLQKTPLRFNFEKHDLSSIASLAELRQILQSANIVVDLTSTQSFGWLALEALASGATVFAANPDQNKSKWELLQLAPVIDFTAETLPERLAAYLREPKSIRDLAKRSPKFVERCHTMAQLSKVLIEHYKKGIL